MSADPESGLSTLSELRVIELGVWVAAPSAAALLADWGADVIKVEQPAGDPMRHVFGSLGIDSDMPNPAFSLDNRGKRSVVLNLRLPEDREQLEDLLAVGGCLHQQSPARRTRRARSGACRYRRPSPAARLLQHQRLRLAR